jgi:hypothetical protein
MERFGCGDHPWPLRAPARVGGVVRKVKAMVVESRVTCHNRGNYTILYLHGN